MKKISIFALLVCLILSVGALASDTNYTDLTGVTWEYNGSSLCHIQDGNQTIENAMA